MFATNDQIKKLTEAASKKTSPDHPFIFQPLLTSSPYIVLFEYRAGVDHAAVHESEAEIMFVSSGSGTLVLGGTLVDPKRVNAKNLTGMSIDHGSTQQAHGGDVILVPAGVPHFWSVIESPLTLLTMHVPSVTAAQ